MGTAVGLLIVDEPQDLSRTYRAGLEHAPDLRTLAEADLARTGCDRTVALVFADEMRIADGAARVAAIKERSPETRVLVAAQALTAQALRCLLAAGADGVVARSAPPEVVRAALLALAEEAPCLVPAEPAHEAAEELGLTPREAEVLRFLSAGFSNKEVARRLTLSVRTVETHRLNLRRKTQTGRLKDLVSLARQLGLDPVVEGGNVPSRLARH